MPFLAGQIVTAAELNRLQPVTHEAIASIDRIGIASDQDVLGASVTFTSETNGAIYVATGSFDFDTDSAAVPASNEHWSGGLAVDGAVQTARALMAGNNVAVQRGEASKEWRGTLTTAGMHTIKLVVSHDHANMATRSIHTVLHVVIYEIV